MTRVLIASLGLAALLGVAAAADAQTTRPAQPGTNVTAPAFVDANGDGICDRYQAGGAGNGARAGRGARRGPGDGTGNQGVGPRDGTGNGAGRGVGRGPGTPNCDGTGPKGARRGGRR